MSTVTECAKALGEAIVASEEYKNMQITEKAAMSDPAVAEAMGRYLELKNRIDSVMSQADADPDEQQDHSQGGVGPDDAADELVEQQGLVGGSESPGVDPRESLAVLGAEDQPGEHQRGEDPGRFVEDAHEAHAARGAVDRADDRDVGVRGGLEDGQSGADGEEPEEEDPELPGEGRGDEEESPERREEESLHDSALESHAFEQDARGDRHDEVGDVKGEGDEVGFEVRELAADPEVGDQDGVHPRDGP